MAKTEKMIDDLTGEEITYPYISARSIRVELSQTEYAWLGGAGLLVFANGENLGKWVAKQSTNLLRKKEGERDY